jgi:hypothetical protein
VGEARIELESVDRGHEGLTIETDAGAIEDRAAVEQEGEERAVARRLLARGDPTLGAPLVGLGVVEMGVQVLDSRHHQISPPRSVHHCDKPSHGIALPWPLAIVRHRLFVVK